MTTSDQKLLDELISSTLNAIDGSESEKARSVPVVDTQEAVKPVHDVDEILNKLGSTSAGRADHSKEAGDMSSMLDSLLSTDTIMESMELLSVELDQYLSNPEQTRLLSEEDLRRHKGQLVIYKQLAVLYKEYPSDVDNPDSARGKDTQRLLDELQGLGAPPSAVIEKLMMEQLSGLNGEESSGSSDMVKEFEEFMKQAGAGGGIPGFTKEDEEIMKQLSRDPDALKNMLGKDECVIS